MSDATNERSFGTFLRDFVDHPASVDETYWQHLCFALWFSARLFAAGFAALIHALLPPMFKTTASRIVRGLYERTSARTVSSHAAVEPQGLVEGQRQ